MPRNHMILNKKLLNSLKAPFKNKEIDPINFNFLCPNSTQTDNCSIKRVITLTQDKLQKLLQVSQEVLKNQPQSAPYLPSISRELDKLMKEILEIEGLLSGNQKSNVNLLDFRLMDVDQALLESNFNYNESDDNNNSNSNKSPINQPPIRLPNSSSTFHHSNPLTVLTNPFSTKNKSTALSKQEICKCIFLSIVTRNLFNHTISGIEKCQEIQPHDFKDRDNRRLKEFNSISLTLQFILHEVKQFVEITKKMSNIASSTNSTNNKFGQPYRVTKEDAHQFWIRKFGSETIIINMNLFFNAFEQKFGKIANSQDKEDLSQHIDITKSGYLSIYSFDTFVRLFSPWKSALKVWESLAKNHKAFKAYMTYDEASHRLSSQKYKPKSYIYRMSTTRSGQWAIAYKTENKVLQTIPQSQNLADALIQGLGDDLYLHPDGQIMSRQQLKEMKDNLIKLADEDVEEVEIPRDDTIYTSIGTTFELCKLCYCLGEFEYFFLLNKF